MTIFYDGKSYPVNISPDLAYSEYYEQPIDYQTFIFHGYFYKEAYYEDLIPRDLILKILDKKADYDASLMKIIEFPDFIYFYHKDKEKDFKIKRENIEPLYESY